MERKSKLHNNPINTEDLLHRLVAIDSVTDSPKESAPIDVLKEIFKENNINYAIYGEGTKRSIVAEFGEGDKSFMFNTHFDVVPAKTDTQFQPTRRDGRMFGRGSADAKGPLAAMTTAFLQLKDLKPNGKVMLACVCDEENAGYQGTRILAEKDIVGTYNIFGEPTGMKPIIAEKGFLRLNIGMPGKESHAAFPEQGDNAIAKMARGIVDMQELQFSETHPLLSPLTISFGLIKGGTKINIGAGNCELGVDIRYLPGQNEEQVKDDVTQRFRRIDPSTKVDVISSGPPYEADPKSKLVQSAVELLGKDPIGVSFATDARFYQNSENIICGPGAAEAAHQQDESISLQELQQAVDFYREVALKCLN